MATAPWLVATLARSGRVARTLTVHRPDYVGAVVPLAVLSGWRLSWGKRDEGFGDNVLMSRFTFAALDRDGAIYDTLVAASASGTAEAYRVTLTGSDGSSWTGLVRLDVAERSLDVTRGRTVEMAAVCGLVYGSERPATFGATTVYGQLIGQLIGGSTSGLYGTAPVGVELPVRFAQSWRSVVDASAAKGFDKLFLNSLAGWLDDSGAIDTTSTEVLRQLLDAFGLRAWQGLDGVWHVCERVMIGESVPAASTDAMLVGSPFDASAPTITRPAVSAQERTITPGELARDGMLFTVDRIGGVRLVREIPAVLSGGVPLPFSVVKDGTFIDCPANVATRWTASPAGTLVTQAVGSGRAMRLDPGVTATQPTAWVEAGTAVYPYLLFQAATVPGASPASNLYIHIRHRVYLDPADDSERLYLDRAGTWATATDRGWIDGPFDDDVQAERLISGNWGGSVKAVSFAAAPPPKTGQLSVAFTAPDATDPSYGTGGYMLVGKVELRLYDKPAVAGTPSIGTGGGSYTASTASTPPADGKPATSYKALIRPIATGWRPRDPIIEMARPFGDFGPSEAQISVDPTVSLTTPALWQAAPDGPIYSDHFELVARERIAQQDRALVGLSATLLGIYPPEAALVASGLPGIADGTRFVAVWCEIDEQDRTRGLWLEKRAFYVDPLLTATVEIEA